MEQNKTVNATFRKLVEEQVLSEEHTIHLQTAFDEAVEKRVNFIIEEQKKVYEEAADKYASHILEEAKVKYDIIKEESVADWSTKTLSLHEEEIKAYQENIGEAEEAIETFIRKNKELSSIIEEAEEAIEFLKTKIIERDLEVEDMQNELEVLEESKKSLLHKNKQLTNRLNDLKEESIKYKYKDRTIKEEEVTRKKNINIISSFVSQEEQIQPKKVVEEQTYSTTEREILGYMPKNMC